jgi:hypothetical protein
VKHFSHALAELAVAIVIVAYGAVINAYDWARGEFDDETL